MNTANENYLVIKYHPEQWKAEFTVYREGERHKDSDKLNNCYGSAFFLQKQGKKFFDDIANPFSGYPSIDINAVMTKEDFEDFKKMVESYNKEAVETKFNCSISRQLPGMGEIAENIREYGKNVANVLEDYSGKFRVLNQNINNVNSETNPVNKIIGNLKEYRAKIDEFQKNFEDTNVNICFVGVYSSGKSTLINAILGHPILPAAKKSETAWRCCIKSPKEGEKVRVEFRLNDIKEDIVIEWDEANLGFVIKNSVKNEILNSVQTVLNENRGNRQDKQLKGILEEIKKNSSALTDNSINVFYKVPLDGNSAKFTIYDTPGADSNNEEHKKVLQDLLKDQTHSILIFVLDPAKSEGFGNRDLLNSIRSNKKDVNLDRLIFVVNKADATQNDEEYEELKEFVNEIIGTDGNKIALKDHILIYTSAGLALNAKAEKNREEEMPFKRIGFDKDDDYTYYLLSHCASEYETQRLNAQSKEAFDKAAENGDEAQQKLVFSGVYALEKEIANYGKRFAPAARAFEMLSEFDKINRGLDGMIKQFEASLAVSKNKTETDINTQLQKLTSAIDEVHKSFTLDRQNKPQAFLGQVTWPLGLDTGNITKFAGSTFQRVQGSWQKAKPADENPSRLKAAVNKVNNLKPAQKIIENIKSILPEVKIRNTDADENAEDAEKELNDSIKKYIGDKKRKCDVQLVKRREALRKAIVNKIRQFDDVDDELKDYLGKISINNIDIPETGKDFKNLYDYNTQHILWLKFVKSKDFMEALEKYILRKVQECAYKIEDVFKQNDDVMAENVKSVFKNHLDDLSGNLKWLKNNKKTFEEAIDNLNEAQKDLAECREDYAKSTNHKEEHI